MSVNRQTAYMTFIERIHPETKQRTVLCYDDIGDGQPIVFIHGWPSSRLMWEPQINFFVEQGYRCIAYDRRGFGMSSKPLHGYNYDEFTDDLYELMKQLDLRDVILVGFSMGGGEVARYFSRHKGERVSRAILLGSVTPHLIQTEENPEGIDRKVFNSMIDAIQTDRPAFVEGFFNDFFGVNLVNKPVSKAMLEYQRSIALMASPIATQACVHAFSETDFSADLSHIHVPTLIIHGDADKIVPEDVSANLTCTMINDSQFILYAGAPHGFFLTHKEKLNNDIQLFLNSAL